MLQKNAGGFSQANRNRAAKSVLKSMMESIKIVALCILAAIGFGIIHDQVTARVCLEYFTVAHPPVFNTTSPTLLGLGWGIIATWWVGFFLGVPLALATRCGKRATLSSRQLTPAILKLLGVMAVVSLSAGNIGFVLAARGAVPIPEFMADSIPREHHARFMADWWAHSASYLGGFVGGIVVIVSAWFRRKRAGG